MADGGLPALSIRRVPFVEGHALIAHMLRDHYEELAQFKDSDVLEPDTERYLRIEAAGLLLFLVAESDGYPVGYSVSILANNLHYSATIVMQNDVLYVDRVHRHGRLGLQLIRATEKIAKESGAHRMIWHAKKDTPLDMLLPKLGYQVLDIMHVRTL